MLMWFFRPRNRALEALSARRPPSGVGPTRVTHALGLLRGLCAKYRVQGSGFRVQGSGFRVQGSGFRVQGSGFRVYGLGFRVYGLGCRGLAAKKHLSLTQ